MIFKNLFNALMELSLALQLWVRVGLGVMAMKEYSTLHIDPGLEPHRQMQFSVLLWTCQK